MLCRTMLWLKIFGIFVKILIKAVIVCLVEFGEFIEVVCALMLIK